MRGTAVLALAALIPTVPQSSRTPLAVHCVRVSSPARLLSGFGFRQDLPRGLELRLEPDRPGVWFIKVTPRGGTDDFVWIVSPPFQTAPQLVIGAAYGVTAGESAQARRWLRFVPTTAEYARALHAYEEWRAGRLHAPAYSRWLRGGGDLETGTLRLEVTGFALADGAEGLAWIHVEGEACVPAGPPLRPEGDNRPAPDTAISTDELIDRFKREQLFTRQFEIAERLAAGGDRRSVRQLEDWLTHPDRRIRGNVAFVLARLDDPRGFQTLAGILADSRPRLPEAVDPGGSHARRQLVEERYYAAHLFGELKDRRAVPLLIPLLSDEDVRSTVPWALARIGDRRGIAPLLDILQRDDPFMRVLAILALQELNAVEALPRLRELLGDTREVSVGKRTTVRDAASRAIAVLEKIGV